MSLQTAVAALKLAHNLALPMDTVPPTPLKIAVVGSGIAGLTAAFLLARAGHHVEIFERVTRHIHMQGPRGGWTEATKPKKGPKTLGAPDSNPP